MECGAMRCGASIITAVAMAAVTVGWCGSAGFAQTAQPEAQKDAPAPSDNPSPGAPSNATGNSMIGVWEFSNADHDKICRFNFRADAVPGGSRLDIDKKCPNAFPSTKEIVAWSLDSYGNLRLLDAQSNAVMELTEVESGMFDGFTPEEGRYILQTAAAAAPLRSADDMAGDWGIALGTGKPICMLTLSNSPPGGDVLALKVKPGCDALVTRFGPAGWRMEQGGLELLSARGQSWQFEATDANTWQRVPESADPMLLVRQ
jgi:hypothetical protein